jgi:hypothetical protein
MGWNHGLTFTFTVHRKRKGFAGVYGFRDGASTREGWPTPIFRVGDVAWVDRLDGIEGVLGFNDTQVSESPA